MTFLRRARSPKHTLFLSVLMCAQLILGGCASGNYVEDEGIDPKDIPEAAPSVTEMQEVFPEQATSNQPSTVKIEIALSDGRMGLCAGTLISATTVLTAAQCVSELSATDMVLRTGGARAVSVFDGSQETQRIQVVDSAFHPDWNDTNFHDGVDLGLIYLAAPIGVEPVVLDSTPAVNRTEMTGTSVGFSRNGAGQVDQQTQARMSITEFVNQQLLLKGAEQSARRSCTGDSGPLFVEQGESSSSQGSRLGDRRGVRSMTRILWPLSDIWTGFKKIWPAQPLLFDKKPNILGHSAVGRQSVV